MAESIRETTVQYPSGKVVIMRAFVAAPQAKEKRPAIIIVQEWVWAHRPYQGYCETVCSRRVCCDRTGSLLPFGTSPHYRCRGGGEVDEYLKQEDGLNDLKETVAYLKSAPEVDVTRIGVTGFCMGGSYALMLPCVNPEIKAAVPFYGQVPNPDTPLQKLGCPLLYFYGEDDGWITKADVQRLAAALKKYGKAGEIKTYPGAPHAFFRDTDPSVYRPDAAKDAWARAKAFFKQHLG